MAAVFPTAIKTFSSRQNFVNIVDAGDVNQAYDEISSLQTVLGTMPQTDTVDGKVLAWTNVKANINSVRRGLTEPVVRVTATNIKVPFGKEFFPAWTSKQVDTHAAWKGGPYLTCPRSGYYTFNAYIRWHKDGANTANQVAEYDHSGKLQLAISVGPGNDILTGETHYFPKGWRDLTRSSCSIMLYWTKGTQIHLNLWQKVQQHGTMYATAQLSAVYHRDAATANNM